MSVRGLAIVAVLLLLLLLGTGYVGARRLGWIAPGGPPRLCFVNYTLAAATGDVLEVRPLHPSVPQIRFVVDHLERNPDPEEEPKYALPHAVVGRGFKEPGQPDFSFEGWGALAFDRLGAPTAQEWLIGIRTGWELRGKQRVPVVIAEFRGSDGRVRRYFFDPDHPQIPLGWYRTEVLGPNDPENYMGISRVDPAEARKRAATCGGGSH